MTYRQAVIEQSTETNRLQRIGTTIDALLDRLAGTDPAKRAVLARQRAARAGFTILTECEWPPIPTRMFDYRAWYAGEEDEQMDCGWGSTEAEAICDLADNYSRPR